ncbi:MAG: S-layer homology domain-containing protein, partial [Oscillospiraceae bacterium]
NLFTNATKFSMASGGVLNGLLYAPVTDSVVACSSAINGIVITKTLDMYKDSRISYAPVSTDIVIPPATETPVDPAPVDPTEPTDPTEPPVNDIPAGSEVSLNFQYAYLYGYDNEKMTVGAEDPITREEAAALLYRLLKQDNKLGDFTPTASTFKDISDTHWSKNALMYMKHIGVYTDDMVYPTREISRGEVAKIICFALRIQPDSNKTIDFSDLKPTNQYYWYIKALADKGIMEGFDGKINPDTSITRAEYVASLNRLLGRGDNYMIDNYKEIYNNFYNYETVVDGQKVQAHKNHYGHFICTNDSIYPDLTDKSYWAYDEIMRASLGFTDVPVGGVYLVDPEKKPDRSLIDYN